MDGTEKVAGRPNNAARPRGDGKSIQRYVAAFDVLGFKQRLEVHNVKRLQADYDALKIRADESIRAAQRGVSAGPPTQSPALLEFATMSDTILLWCDRDGDTKAFVAGCCALIAESVRAGMPLRGGIAFGATVIDRKTNTYLGQPLVDAHFAELQQEWVGAAVHSTASALYADDLVCEWEVPVKPGTEPLTHALAWHRHTAKAADDLEALRDVAGYVPATKYTNAIEYVRATSLG